jgi:hypothetical protein
VDLDQLRNIGATPTQVRLVLLDFRGQQRALLLPHLQRGGDAQASEVAVVDVHFVARF